VPSRQAFVIDMVEKKEDLGNAIALNSTMFNGARLIGPSIAGILLASTSEGVCFLVNAISYLFVIASLLMMKVDIKRAGSKEHNMFTDLKVGMNYVTSFKPIKHLLMLLSVVSLTGMSYSVLMPVFAKEVLHGGSNTYGFLMGAAGFGALIGALFLASREEVIRLGRIVPAAALVFGVALIILSMTGITMIALIMMVFVGMGMMLQTASSNTILQTLTDDDKRGRVMSFYTMAVMGTAPFGSLLAGGLAKTIGTPHTLLAGGLITIAGALMFLRKLPLLKQIARPVYVKMGVIPEVARGIRAASEPAAETE
jgi:MFS family permease